MGRPRAKTPLFTIGDFVFAKVRGYRAWPARILERVGSSAYNVYFYGTCNHAKVPRDQICDFQKNQRRLGVIRSKGHAYSPDFRGAMLHARQALADPETDYGYYQQIAINKGQCVNVEDLNMDYTVADEGGNQQEDAQEEQWMNQLVEEDLPEQVSQNPLEDLNSGEQLMPNPPEAHNSGELDSKNQPKKQASEKLDSKVKLVEQKSEGQESKKQPEEQDSEQQYAMAQLTALKSNKSDKQNRRLKNKAPKNQGLVTKDVVSKELDSKDQPEKQDGEGETSNDPLVTPGSPMPQLDGLDSEEVEDIREQERISKDRLDKDVQELMHMLDDLEEYSHSKEVQDPECQKVEEMYFMDQPLNLSCCRRR